MEQKVSIIIPVRTITSDVRESVKHIRELNYRNFEVLIFTDEEEDSNFPENFRVISSGKVGPAEKRNLALNFATGEILAFLDDDAFPRPSWLKVAAKDFEDKSVCAVGGPSLTPKTDGFYEHVSGEVLESYLVSGGTVHRHRSKKKMYVDDYPTVNLFVRFSDFKAVGGFDVNFWPGEDTKLCLDLITKTGKRILYDPNLIVYHHRRPMFLPHLKQVSRYAMHRGQFAKIFPRNSRKIQYFVPSAFVTGLFLGPFLAGLDGFFWKVYLGVLGLYIFLVLTQAVKVLFRKKNVWFTVCFIYGVVLTHLTYGLFFLYGLLRRPKLHLRDFDPLSGKYLGG